MHSRAALKFRKKVRKPRNSTKFQFKESNVGRSSPRLHGSPAASAGNCFLLCHRPEQGWKGLWIDSAGAQRANVALIRVTAILPSLGGKVGELMPREHCWWDAGHTEPLQWGKEKAPNSPPRSSLQLSDVLQGMQHTTQITSGNVCPIKKAFAGPDWIAGKCKIPNKEATGKGVCISPFSRDRWISLT